MVHLLYVFLLSLLQFVHQESELMGFLLGLLESLLRLNVFLIFVVLRLLLSFLEVDVQLFVDGLEIVDCFHLFSNVVVFGPDGVLKLLAVGF
jgi:hypothetical protein